MASKQRFYIHGPVEVIEKAFPGRKREDDRVSANGSVALVEVNIPQGEKLDLAPGLTVITHEEATSFVRSAGFTGVEAEKAPRKPSRTEKAKEDAPE
jgi:hypothetical protein